MVAQNNQTVLLTTTNSNAAEVVKFVRQNIQSPEQSITYPPKVVRRNTKVFASERTGNEWEDTFSRRQDQRFCGFFSKTDQQYRECGNVELDTKLLVVDTLGKVGNTFENTSPASHLVIKVNPENEEHVSHTEFQNGKVCRNRGYQSKSDNGINSIKELIERAERRIVSIRAGQSLSAYLRNESRQQMEIEESNKEKEGGQFDMVVIDPLDHGKPGLRGNTEDLDPDHPDIPQECGNRRYFLEKLNNLYMLFLMVHNMKTRDLRTRNQLTPDALKLLKREIIIDATGHPFLQRQARNSVMIHSSREVDAPSKRLNTMEGGMRLFPSMHREIASRTDLASPNMMRKRNVPSVQKSSTASSTRVRLDNWDDLLTVECSQRAESTSLDADNMRAVSRMSVQPGKYQPTVKRRAGMLCRNTAVADTTPIWQKLMHEPKNESKKDIQNAKKLCAANEPKSKKHDQILEQLKSGFEKTRTHAAAKVKRELANRIEGFQKRLELLELHHLREEDLPLMRTKLNEWRREVSISMARPSDWFEILKFDQKSCQLEDDKECNAMLQKLLPFSHSDLMSSPFSKAKLCLLVFSLPVYELCTVVMQESLTFFLERILDSQGQYLNEWMQARKLQPAPQK